MNTDELKKLRDILNEKGWWSRLYYNEKNNTIVVYTYDEIDYPTFNGVTIEYKPVPPLGIIGDELTQHLYDTGIPFSIVNWLEEENMLEVIVEKEPAVTIDIFQATPVKWSVK